jgi:hypothetical protein
MNWRNCGREYEIIEYDDSCLPWKEARRVTVLSVSACGTKWTGGAEDAFPAP